MNIGQKVSFTGYIVKDHTVIDGQVHTTHPLHKLDKPRVGYVVGARTLRDGYTEHITEYPNMFCDMPDKIATFFPTNTISVYLVAETLYTNPVKVPAYHIKAID